jgi:rSAM/selenodomain-associated transferase 2
VPSFHLTVIIPARDEQGSIGPVVERAAAGRPLEVIVVDGGSRDRTVEIAAEHGALVIGDPQGRGSQMDTGAAAARGDVLLFLHADTLLPHGYADQVREVLERPGVCAGAFPLRVGSPRPSFRIIERAVEWRSRRLQLPYGDQALFLGAETFRRAGGFGGAPAMEDYALVRRLRRMGRIALAASPVVTSPRRWLARGIWRTTLLNQACIAAFRLGAGPERIARWRGRVP